MDPFATITEATLTSLRDNLPGRIAAWNAAHELQLEVPPDNGAPLADDDPGVSYVYGGRSAHPADAYPVVEVATTDAQFFNLSVNQVDGDLDDSLVVTLWSEAPGEQFPQLSRRSNAYAWLLTEVLLVPKACGAGVVVGRIRYRFAAGEENRDEMRVFRMMSRLHLSLETSAARP